MIYVRDDDRALAHGEAGRSRAQQTDATQSRYRLMEMSIKTLMPAAIPNFVMYLDRTA